VKKHCIIRWGVLTKGSPSGIITDIEARGFDSTGGSKMTTTTTATETADTMIRYHGFGSGESCSHIKAYELFTTQWIDNNNPELKAYWGEVITALTAKWQVAKRLKVLEKSGPEILDAIATDQLITAVGENARIMEAIGRDD